MSGGDVQVVQLPSHFSQVQLSGLKTIVDHHVVDGHPVQFDASDLERIDGAAVQFLLAVSAMASAVPKNGVVVVNANDTLTGALNDMGVAELVKTEADERDEPDTAASDE